LDEAVKELLKDLFPPLDVEFLGEPIPVECHMSHTAYWQNVHTIEETGERFGVLTRPSSVSLHLVFEYNGTKPPKDWEQYHSPRCGSYFRGCAPECPKDIYEKTGVWTGK